MFKEIKKEARKILFKNYKYFLFPTILHILTSCIISTCCYFIFYNDGLTKWATPQFYFFILAVLISQFVFLPLAEYLLFKVSALAVNSKPIKFTFNFSKLLKLVSINLPLIIFGIIKLCLDGLSNNALYMDYGLLILFLSNLIIVCLAYFEYKLFAAFYYLALNGGTAKESVDFSFNLMHKKFWLTVVLGLSLTIWYVLIIALGVVFVKFPNVNELLRICLASTNYGINLIFLPYLCAIHSVFIKKQIEKVAGK